MYIWLSSKGEVGIVVHGCIYINGAPVLRRNYINKKMIVVV